MSFPYAANKDVEQAGGLAGAWRTMVQHIVQDVPEDDALCEFDCRKKQCTIGEWAVCYRRRSGAAGELAPDNREARRPGK